MKQLVLIDGNALMHRAYHAMPNLTNSHGETVGAVYGFFSMFLNILHEQKPEYIIVCFDRSKPTIRQSMFAGYHEHRPPMASDLTSQVTTIDELLEKAGVLIASADGYEGDDVIGTFARQASTTLSAKRNAQSGEDIEVLIVTGDRDLLQLVNEHVRVLMTITGLTKTMLFDEDAVEEKYGVKPSQFVDYKALIGDPSDGYPGITGIGPKTASSLIKEYGSFEELYKQLSLLPEKTALKLATDAEQGALAKKLATIITDAPVHLDLSKAKVADLKIEELAEGFSQHNFKSLIARLEKQYPQLTAPKKKAKKSSPPEGQMGLL